MKVTEMTVKRRVQIYLIWDSRHNFVSGTARYPAHILNTFSFVSRRRIPWTPLAKDTPSVNRPSPPIKTSRLILALGVCGSYSTPNAKTRLVPNSCGRTLAYSIPLPRCALCIFGDVESRRKHALSWNIGDIESRRISHSISRWRMAQ